MLRNIKASFWGPKHVNRIRTQYNLLRAIVTQIISISRISFAKRQGRIRERAMGAITPGPPVRGAPYKKVVKSHFLKKKKVCQNQVSKKAYEPRKIDYNVTYTFGLYKLSKLASVPCVLTHLIDQHASHCIGEMSESDFGFDRV